MFHHSARTVGARSPIWLMNRCRRGLEVSRTMAYDPGETPDRDRMPGVGPNDMNDIDLRHRTAVVTGGARGIGLAIAQRLASSGARVAIWDRDGAAATAAAGSVAESFPQTVD